MEKQDLFREIAMTKHPIGTADREVEPAPPSAEVYGPCKEQGAAIHQEKDWTFEERSARFDTELAAMRKRFRPFMADELTNQQAAAAVPTLTLDDFSFRYKHVYGKELPEDTAWEAVEIPDFRGPSEEDGKWQAYYRTHFTRRALTQLLPDAAGHPDARVVLCFDCVDYIAEVYVNGRFAGSHEGFFAPFSFDITELLKEENELLILVKNDIPILGTGPVLDGDKIYAATGPGWDEPVTGWHHCPAGGGILGAVRLQLRPSLYIDDIFVRPDIDTDTAEIRVGIMNYTDEVFADYHLELALLPKNYSGAAIGNVSHKVAFAGPGRNEYRFTADLKDYRLWDMETPWLYGASASLFNIEETRVSARVQTFGIKKFVSDETTVPKGKFFLNNRPIVLRGANEMGHLQQCVMKGDFGQLIDDILIAKMCHMNFYRMTQRPVQSEIYDYFDMLGIMHQCDLPLFGFLRRPQFAEAVRQSQEMEHLIRSHVSSCMVTFINEPMCIRKTGDPNDKFSKRYEAKGHRHLQRDELEAFFVAARQAVYIENPDRVIKNVEGDYDGPTADGMPDFHCYTMWYTNHGVPIGKLMAGYLPPVKEGWMSGCGEYGAEGLDNEHVMRTRYPKEWLEKQPDGSWYPNRIVRSQTPMQQGDWYKEPSTLADWVEKSQIHQANATKLMTDAFRRRGDVISQTAIHLLIDAWPSGWMKTLVDCERRPKRAYFAYEDALVCRRVNLYTPRRTAYTDECVDVEAWFLNDGEDAGDGRIRVSIWEEAAKEPYAVFDKTFRMEAATAICTGNVPVTFAQTEEARRTVAVFGELLDASGKVIATETIRIEVFARPARARAAAVIGDGAKEICRRLSLRQDADADVCLVTDTAPSSIEKLEAFTSSGGTGILFLPHAGEQLCIGGHVVRMKDCGALFFVAADEKYEDYPLNMVYNVRKKYIDFSADTVIETDLPGVNLVYTYDKHGVNADSGRKGHLPFVRRCHLGSGTLILISLSLQDRLGANPGLDNMIRDLISE